MVSRMRTTRRINATLRQLDVALFDRLTAARGAHTIDEKAALCGMHRATLFAWRAGPADPALSVATTIAAQLGVKVERLFPPAEVGEAA